MGSEVLVTQRARRIALAALALAAAAVATHLLLGSLWSGSGRDPGQDEFLVYPGLTFADAALGALVLGTVLLFTLSAARRPRVAVAAWVLTGLTALAALGQGATALASAGPSGAIATAALDTDAGWLALSQARLVTLTLLLAVQGAAALLLLGAARAALPLRTASFLLRCLAALPLATGVWVGVGSLPWALTVPDQASGFYLANAAIALVPAAVYGTAVVLLFVGRPPRSVWLVLLAVGLAYGLFILALSWREEFWPPALVAPLTLALIAGVSALRRGREPSAVPS